MHHPPKKYTRTIRNQAASGTLLLVGRQLPDLPRFKDNKPKDNKHARSLVCKDKFFKIEDFQLDFDALKVDGKEVGSSLNLQAFRINYKPKSLASDKIVSQSGTEQTKKSILRHQNTKDKLYSSKMKKEQQHPSSDHKIAESIDAKTKQKENSFEGTNGLPDINSRDIELKGSPKKESIVEVNRTSQRKSDRESTHVPKAIKRRDTVADVNTRNAYNQENLKSKQDFKKVIMLMQYRQFLLTISLTNRLIVVPEEETQYKAYICKGNNGLLVKSILKTRPWWSVRAPNQIDNCHLVWTQWKRNKSINLLPTKDSQKLANASMTSFDLEIKTANKEVRGSMEKKYGYFCKIVGRNTNLCKTYESSMLSQSFLTFTSKINSKSFDSAVQKVFKADSKFLSRLADGDKKMANHIPGCLYLHSKKLLFQSILRYYQKIQKDIFNVIPITFLISKGLNDPEFERFSQYFEQTAAKAKADKKNGCVWICKPGENSNRGNGIQVVSSIAEVRSLVSQKCGSSRTLIIQKYMETPFLYNKRKFDIRCYILITCVNGCVKGYWYEEGYVRTASKEYTLKNLENKLIHLTNDAIQKKGEEYGRFEGCNKVSFAQLEKYIQSNTQIKFKTVYDRIKLIATHLIHSVANKINPKHKQFTFQLFGLDFMLDDKLNPFLIEANSNPCLEVDGNVLGKVIPRMVENVMRVAIDPIFPPPYSESLRCRYSPGSSFEANQFVLVYDSLHDHFQESREEGDELLANEKQCEMFEGEQDQD